MYRIDRLVPAQRARLDLVAEDPSFSRLRLDVHRARIDLLSNDDAFIEPFRAGYSFFETDSSAPGRDGRVHRFVAFGEEGPRYAEAARILYERSPPPSCFIAAESFGRAYAFTTPDLLLHHFGTFFTACVESVLYDRFLILHGAAVVKDGLGIALPGALRCGKTTLTMNLLERGFRFASDDIVMLDRDDLTVHAYPRLLNLRQESLRLVDGIHRHYDRMIHAAPFGEPRWFLDMSERAAPPFEVDHFVFPTLSDGPTRLEPLGKADAALNLIRNSFYPITPIRRYGNTGENLEVIGRALDRAGTWILRHGRDGDAPDLLVERLSRVRT